MFDDEEYEEPVIPYLGLEKGIVLQEKQFFYESPLNASQCMQTLNKILYLLSQGEKFNKKEATELFFAATRLFSSRDIPLRRRVYILLKELTPIASDVIMIISSLQKDINSNSVLYRANAIRVICGIVDQSLLGTIERYMKQAIVDKDGHIGSCALVSTSLLMKTCHESIKRWAPEIQEALQSRNPMVQYHALGLLYQIRRGDRLAVAKLVSGLVKGSVRSPYAYILLVRLATQIIVDEERTGSSSGETKALFSFLENCLRNKHDMVVLEAARSICSIKSMTERDVSTAITTLQLFLSSGRSILRFSALRTLSQVAQVFPNAVAACNIDLENLIPDSNRSISTLAVTTLLKTGSENNIERLMKHISSFMNEISDEFRVVVVDAVRTLCTKFPQKQKILLNFLASILRDEGGFEFKHAVVDAILQIVRDMPETKEFALGHLCEFIEDCEFPYLTNKILHLLGAEGPRTVHPSKYIRYIYNRISLEAAPVRATAVSALTKFGMALESLRPSITVLLSRSLYDNDDEVRDRAILGLNTLKEKSETANNSLSAAWFLPWENLEKALLDFQKEPSETPFNIKSVSTVVRTKTTGPSEEEKVTEYIKPKEESQDLYSTLLLSIPEFAHIGKLVKSSKPAQLTELETEYVVNCVKHVFPAHIVLQFNVTNTVQEQLLEKLTIKIDVSGAKGAKIETVIPVETLPYGPPSSIYVLLSKPSTVFATIACTLKCVVKEIDPKTGQPDDEGFDESYNLDDLELSLADFVKPVHITNFSEKWTQMTTLVEQGSAFEVVNTVSLGQAKNLQQGVEKLVSFLGMKAVENSEKVPAKRTKHILYLCGSFLGAQVIPVLIEAKMRLISQEGGVAMQLVVRSTSAEVSQLVAKSI